MTLSSHGSEHNFCWLTVRIVLRFDWSLAWQFSYAMCSRYGTAVWIDFQCCCWNSWWCLRPRDASLWTLAPRTQQCLSTTPLPPPWALLFQTFTISVTNLYGPLTTATQTPPCLSLVSSHKSLVPQVSTASFVSSLLYPVMHQCTYHLALEMAFLGFYPSLFGGVAERSLDDPTSGSSLFRFVDP